MLYHYILATAHFGGMGRRSVAHPGRKYGVAGWRRGVRADPGSVGHSLSTRDETVPECLTLLVVIHYAIEQEVSL